jgi:hypothetical protein
MMKPTTVLQILLIATATTLWHLAPRAAADDAAPTLDELLNIDTGEKRRPTPPQVPAPLRPEDDAGGKGNTLEAVASRMRIVAGRLGPDLDPGLATQRMQESILAQLDKMIEAADKRSSQSSSSSSSGKPQGSARKQDTGSKANAPQKGAAKGDKGKDGKQPSSLSSTPTLTNTGPTKRGGKAHQQNQEAGPLNQSRVEWGNLPPRLRDEVMQGVNDRSSALYRRLTDAYFRRLAEESK